MFKSLSLKVIVFGFIFTFFSSFGQSFFLGLFNSSIRDALSITHGQFGSIYASATLLSSIVLVWIGKKIDDVNILKFASYVIIFLSASCFIFSKISSVIFLFVGIFLMRLAGQGLSSHTATTTISRFFEKNRGRALSTGWLGLSLAEFILPVLIVFLLTFIEWRDIWVSISILVILVLPVATFYLVKEVKQYSTVPVALGFGISTKIHLAEVNKLADAGIIGSALVNIISNSDENTVVQNATDFLKE